jgi:hypothetical protein
MTTWASRFSVCQNTLTAKAMPLDLDLVVAAQAAAVAPLSRVVAKEGAVETRRLLDERGLAVSSLIRASVSSTALASRPARPCSTTFASPRPSGRHCCW